MTPTMPDKDEIAVIIPAFNSGAHLEQALASVAGQTLPPATVVVVDDCSVDDTTDRARKWQGHLPLEIIRLERNRGPGFARTAPSGAARLRCWPCWMRMICSCLTISRP